MEKSKALFGEAESIMESTRKQPSLIARRIKSNEKKANKHNSKAINASKSNAMPHNKNQFVK